MTRWLAKKPAQQEALSSTNQPLSISLSTSCRVSLILIYKLLNYFKSINFIFFFFFFFFFSLRRRYSYCYFYLIYTTGLRVVLADGGVRGENGILYGSHKNIKIQLNSTQKYRINIILIA
jgi:hypothetical protein